MAGLKEQAQIEVIINGTKATATIAEMEKAVKILSAQLKHLTPDSEDFIEKSKEFQQISARLQEVRNSVKGVSTETGKMREQIISLTPGGSIIQGYVTQFNAARTAVMANVTGMNLLKLAIIGTGIGALIVLLGTAVAWFKKNDDAVRIFEGTMNALGNAVDFLVARFDALIRGDFKAAFSGFTEGLVDAAKAGYDTANALDELDSAQRRAQTTIAEYDNQIKLLTISLKNKNLSEKEALGIVDQILTLDKKRLQAETDLVNQEIAISEKNLLRKIKEANTTVDLSKKTSKQILDDLEDGKLRQGAIADDELTKFQELQTQKIELVGKSADLQEKINNKLDLLDSRYAAERQKRQQQKEKDDAAAEKKLLATQEFIKNTTIEIIEDGYKKEKALQNKKFDEDMAAYGDNQNAFNLITEKYKQDTIELDKKYADIKAANEKKAFEKQLEDNQLGFEILYEQAKTNYLEGYLSEEEYQNTLLTLQYSAESQKLELLQNSGRATELELQQQANKVLQITQNKNAARLANERQTAQAIGTVASTLGGFVNTVMSIGSENYAAMTEQQKIAAGIQIAVNMATGIAGLVAAGASDASSVTWFERVAKVVASAGIVIAGIANATSLLSSAGSAPDANIKDTPSSPSFAGGGFTGPGFGMPDASGYRPAGIVHEEEWVARRSMVRSPVYGPIIQLLENARVNGYDKGGFVSAATPSQGGGGGYFRIHPDDLEEIGNQVKGNIQTELNLEYFDKEKAKIELIKSNT